VVKKFTVFIYIMKLIKDHTSVLWNQGQSNNYNKWSQNHIYIYIYIYIYILLFMQTFLVFIKIKINLDFKILQIHLMCYHESLDKNYIQNLQNSFQDQDINGMFG
jgi:hypothetical protein